MYYKIKDLKSEVFRLVYYATSKDAVSVGSLGADIVNQLESVLDSYNELVRKYDALVSNSHGVSDSESELDSDSGSGIPF